MHIKKSSLECNSYMASLPSNFQIRLHVITEIFYVYTFMPTSIGDKSANGTSRVASSHSSMAKLHMSHASQLRSLGFFCRATETKYYQACLFVHKIKYFVKIRYTSPPHWPRLRIKLWAPLC